MVVIYALFTAFMLAFSAGKQCDVLFFEREHIERPDNFATTPLRDKGQLVTVSMNLNQFFVRHPDAKNLPHIVQTNSIGIEAKSNKEIQAYLEVLNNLSADVYAFQEVVGSYSTRALDPRGEYHHLTDSPSDMAGMQNVFMVRKTLDVEAKLIQPESTNLRVTPRGLPVLKIRAKDENGKVISPNQPDILIMGVHLKSKRNLEEHEYRGIKTNELKSLAAAYIEMRKKFPTAPFMVTGDFNLAMNSNNPMLTVLKKYFKDSLELTHPEYDLLDRATKFYFEGKKLNANEYDAALILRELTDRLVDSFVYHHKSPLPRLKELILENGTRVPITHENLLTIKGVSDHFPLVSVFDFAKKPVEL